MFEWFFQWYDSIIQNMVFYTLLERVQWVDWFSILFIVLGILYGIQNGFMAEIAEIGQVFIVITVTHSYYKHLQNFIAGYIHSMPKYMQLYPEEYNGVVAFLLTMMATWILLAVIFNYLKRFVHTKTSKPLHVVGGGILGGLHLFIIFSLISQAIILMPLQQVQRVYESKISYTGYYLARLSPSIHQMVSQPVKIFTEEESP